MTIPLLASSLIDGIYAFDATSCGQSAHHLAHHLQAAPLSGLVNLGIVKLTGHGLVVNLPADGMVLGQYFETDVFAGTRAWWSDFVSSGKIWTLIFGIVLGYLLRALTSYG
ncbi:MAG: hypothetical protein ACFB5Z_07550 [Elainellaceae cyanobacterium]